MGAARGFRCHARERAPASRGQRNGCALGDVATVYRTRGRPPAGSILRVLALDINEDSIHIVHQKPGYSDADAIVHFHVAKLIYLGEVFAGDGYPAIDPAQGGTLAGLLSTLDAWAGSTFRFVPARGEVTNGASVKAFRDMIVAVRDRVKHRMDEGRTEAQIVAEHPTADFDARWGKGRLQPDQFVHAVYAALKNGNQK